ncbi:site-2 protease family protein [Nonomuraea soli]|uniref:Zinc metalloprotease n=1 Tax=Nonomuraea soli TaxID=1032476 RepID=A0A7W0CSE3_9ACTN|nr:site-2 protease family protein [Nonomuraea soli]MBA2896315.1 Zn-dependent protease [Nonomuraea soli]
MRPTIPLGRMGGVPVGLNLSVVLILAILILGLAFGRFPAAFPGYGTALYLVAATLAAVLFLASLLAHELAHALVARGEGVEVAGITLWLLGGVAELKGEARSPGADLRIAAVGPLTSLGCALLFLVLSLPLTGLAEGTLLYLAGVNLVLALFNLIPAAPLDGGRVLRAGLWAWKRDRTFAAVTAAKAGRIFGYVLIAAGLLEVVTGLGLQGLWLAMIGLFLVNAAAAEEAQAKASSVLQGLRVGEVMSAPAVTADPDESVFSFVGRVLLHSRFSAYPLIGRDGHFAGLVTLNRIRALPRERHAATRLSEIACPPDQLPLTRADEVLVELLPRMNGCADGRAVVLDETGRVAGIVSPSDISRAIQRGDLRSYAQRGADLR